MAVIGKTPSTRLYMPIGRADAILKKVGTIYCKQCFRNIRNHCDVTDIPDYVPKKVRTRPSGVKNEESITELDPNELIMAPPKNKPKKRLVSG